MAGSKPTQAFVPVKEVRNGIIILKDGSYRGIIMCSSLNFALKSEGEQRAIIGGFQNFLNTLDFSVEIVIHSRKMDIRPYLELLSGRLDAQQSDLMKLQVREYLQFIRTFTDNANIMTKTFYLIVPYVPAAANKVTSSLPFFGKSTENAPTALQDSFEEYRVQLEQRMALVASGIAATGIRTATLGTEEVIELLYRSFNQGELDSPVRLADQSYGTA